MTPKTVLVKGTYGLSEVGIGSVLARLLWDSVPAEDGSLAHLSRDAAGGWWLSLTDMEEPFGSYVSVPLSGHDLARLVIALQEVVADDGS